VPTPGKQKVRASTGGVVVGMGHVEMRVASSLRESAGSVALCAGRSALSLKGLFAQV